MWRYILPYVFSFTSQRRRPLHSLLWKSVLLADEQNGAQRNPKVHHRRKRNNWRKSAAWDSSFPRRGSGWRLKQSTWKHILGNKIFLPIAVFHEKDHWESLSQTTTTRQADWQFRSLSGKIPPNKQLRWNSWLLTECSAPLLLHWFQIWQEKWDFLLLRFTLIVLEGYHNYEDVVMEMEEADDAEADDPDMTSSSENAMKTVARVRQEFPESWMYTESIKTAVIKSTLISLNSKCHHHSMVDIKTFSLPVLFNLGFDGRMRHLYKNTLHPASTKMEMNCDYVISRAWLNWKRKWNCAECFQKYEFERNRKSIH